MNKESKPLKEEHHSEPSNLATIVIIIAVIGVWGLASTYL